MTHNRKIPHKLFNRILSNKEKGLLVLSKTEDWRAGDWLTLKEYDYKKNKATGAELHVRITAIELKPVFGIEVENVFL